HWSHADRACNSRPQPSSPTSDRGLGYRAPLDRVRGADFLVDPSCLSAGLVHQYLQISLWRVCLFRRPRNRARCDILRYAGNAMKKIILLAYAVAVFSLSIASLASESQRKIAFRRGGNVWVANLDGTAAKKIVVGSWPN